jgi:hypothetical protein
MLHGFVLIGVALGEVGAVEGLIIFLMVIGAVFCVFFLALEVSPQEKQKLSIKPETPQMSIMPVGGWDIPPQQATDSKNDLNQQSQIVYPDQKTNTPKCSTRLLCKICDRGTLRQKSVYRLSGPAVAIGYILLIPSVIGMTVCLFMFVSSSVSATNQPYQSASDAKYRLNCAKGMKQAYYRQHGTIASQKFIEQSCECFLSVYKETGSVTSAPDTCGKQLRDGTLATPSKEVDTFYSDGSTNSSSENEASKVTRNIAFIFGVMSFVGGLFGWLLVMKKQVLQCDLCGAVVNAS